MIIIEDTYPLKSLNTFGIRAAAKIFVEVSTPEDLRTMVRVFRDNPLPKLILGGGSNILFTGDFEGIVFYPDIKGREIINQDEDFVWLQVHCGENWDDLVAFCVSRGWGGLENLSLIPGNVGACPIQNIGAYGVEVKDTIDSVEAMDMEHGDIRIFSNKECRFGYRDSIFKNELKGKYIIVSVTFKLAKKPVLNSGYKDLAEQLSQNPEITLSGVRQAVIDIRRRKLPDPADIGNAGSFFKNPVIEKSQFDKLKESFPDVPSYPSPNGTVKIPAAWLIQNGGWKGIREGNTGTHPNQPLVIVNYGNATGEEIISFARKVQASVLEKFGIELEMEVRVV